LKAISTLAIERIMAITVSDRLLHIIQDVLGSRNLRKVTIRRFIAKIFVRVGFNFHFSIGFFLSSADARLDDPSNLRSSDLIMLFPL
jgi:hypothetical protein